VIASAATKSPPRCAPTSSATPPKPTSTPTSLAPLTRWLWSYQMANSTVKIGAEAWITAASPESSRVSP